MSKRRVYYPYSLDAQGITGINSAELASILRAAYDLANAGGRGMLVKVLKGSKEKKVLEYNLDKNPAYGALKDYTTQEVSGCVDYAILSGYLAVEYSGKLPLIYFTTKGWELVVSLYARELFDLVQKSVRSGKDGLPEPFPGIPRDIQYELLRLIQQYGDASYIPVLEEWKPGSVKKVKARITEVTQELSGRKAAIIKPERQDSPMIAVLFPGVGYTCDRPLLHYCRRLFEARGYMVVPVSYGSLPDTAKSSSAGLKQAIQKAGIEAEKALKPFPFEDYRDIVFIGKSIGTKVAIDYALKHKIKARHILLTPIPEILDLPVTDGIAFCGTADPRADAGLMSTRLKEKGIPCHLYEGANHSLETGNVFVDLKAVQDVLETITLFLDKQMP